MGEEDNEERDKGGIAMSKLKSWSCKGCTNVCYRLINGEVAEYCKPALEGRVRHEWVTEDFVDCLDKTMDPEAMDKNIKIYGI